MSGPRTWEAARRYLPALLRAAVITIVLSCLSMALAIAAGALIASGRIYGAAPLRIVLTGYVEIIRGTPLLLQLFVLYFGLAAFVQLPAFIAALLGLGLNYAAYESEIYRGALEAVPSGQLESARTLGFTERQILVLVRAPQAFRLALAPMTNAGLTTLTGAIGGWASRPLRLAPQRLQYFSSIVYSVPQDGQYIMLEW